MKESYSKHQLRSQRKDIDQLLVLHQPELQGTQACIPLSISGYKILSQVNQFSHFALFFVFYCKL